jgi:hypothetical protein
VGDHEGLNCGDELVRRVRTGADLAQDPPVLHLGVRSFTGSAAPGVGGVDVLLESGTLPEPAGVGVLAPTSMRDRDRRPSALVGGVGGGDLVDGQASMIL